MNCNTTHYRANSSSVPGDPTDSLKKAQKGVGVSGPELGVSYSLVGGKVAVAPPFAEMLERVGAKQLTCLATTFAPESAKAGDTKSATEWAAIVRQEATTLETTAPLVGERPKSESTKKPKPAITLAPVVCAEPLVTLHAHERLELPAPGNPIGMEWWHFQRTDLLSKYPTWGGLLGELGWASEALSAVREPAIYHRTGIGYAETDLAKAPR